MTLNFNSLKKQLKSNQLNYNLRRIKSVYFYAKKQYQGQIRHTGEQLIKHPLAVAITLAQWGLDQLSIEGAILHELPEIKPNHHELITKKFGVSLANLVDGVHRVGTIKLRSSKDKVFLENLRKMFVALAKDIRVVIIRLADRLHNIKTLDAIPLSKQKRIAIETLEVYAPLAERLGMGKLKGELEDLVFPFIYPEEYKWVTNIAKPHFKYSEENIKTSITKIRQILAKNGIAAKTDGRPKRKYSLYKKLLRPEIDRDITRVHDLMAVRIITDEDITCYTVLGLMHRYWKPVPYLGISDFIAQPKPNGYRSIHTKVFDHKGNILEIQIRSRHMHLQAEFGAAAHFAYAEAKAAGAKDELLQSGAAFRLDEKMAWVNELSNWKEQVEEAHQQEKDLKLDALSKHIYVFSPKGDVFDLPEDATPIDYAFKVHTNLGFYISGIRINGKIGSISQALKSGDVVEIVKSKTVRPASRNWLHVVKTARAKNKIRKKLLDQEKLI